MHFVIGIIGLIIVLVLGFLISSDRKHIRYSPIVIMLVLQFLLGFILLRTTVGTTIVGGLAGVFDALLRVRVWTLFLAVLLTKRASHFF